MPAHANVIVVAKADIGLAAVLQAATPSIRRLFHTVAVRMLLDTASGGVRELIEDEYPERLGDTELLFLYPPERSRGCVGVSYEGQRYVLTFSLPLSTPLETEARAILGESHTFAELVLAGEELELDGRHIQEWVETGRVPSSLDLCAVSLVP